MKVVITETAEESLWLIYKRHLSYSEEYANNFQRDIDLYMSCTFSKHPKMGNIVHQGRNIRRMVYEKGYNIYYTIQSEVVYILYIFHARLEINQIIRDHGLSLDDIAPSG